MLCAIIAFVTFPLAVSTIMTQTPLPVTLACFAWYGYSGKGALTAIAWAADNDKEVEVEKLVGSDCTAGGARLLTRCFFSAGAAAVVRLRGLDNRCTLSLDALAAISACSSFSLTWAQVSPHLSPSALGDLPKSHPETALMGH